MYAKKASLHWNEFARSGSSGDESLEFDSRVIDVELSHFV